MIRPTFAAARQLIARSVGQRRNIISLFEYLIAGLSFVLALGVVRLLDGFSSVLDSTSRYWPHTLWLVLKFVNHFQVWWFTWAWSEESIEWNFVRFFLLLLSPIVLYLQATALVSSAPNEIQDWRAQYYRVRKRFFALNIMFGAVQPLLYLAFGGTDFSGRAPFVAATIVATSGFCIRYESHRAQAVGALFLAALNVFFVLAVVFRPPSFLQ